MLGTIITRLKTGTYTTVVPYGSARPAPPYVVVRPTADFRGRRFWVYLHMDPGQQSWIEDYVFGELTDLLDEYVADDRHNNTNRLVTDNEYQDIITNDDGTISMGRAFLMPSRFF